MICRAAPGAVAETNHGAIGHYHVIEPLSGFHICSCLPDAVGTLARGHRLELHELHLCLLPQFVQGRTHAVMPLANDVRRGLHDVENVERNGWTIDSTR